MGPLLSELGEIAYVLFELLTLILPFYPFWV